MSDDPQLPPFGWAPIQPSNVPSNVPPNAPAGQPAPAEHNGIAHLLGTFDEQPAAVVPAFGMVPEAHPAPSDGIAQLLGSFGEPGPGSVPAPSRGAAPAFGTTLGASDPLPSRRDLRQRPPRRSTLALIALVIGLAAFGVSLYQPFAIFAIVPAIAAIVLGIVAVIRRGARKALATVGLVIAALAVPIAAFSYSAGLQAGEEPDDLAAAHSSSEPSASPDPSPSASASASAEATPAPVVPAPPTTTVRDARLGGTAKDSRGVSFTLQAVNCGLEDANGTAPQSEHQFCAVQFSAVNRGGSTVTLTTSDVSLVRADSAFWATVADFGGSSTAAIGSGASTSGTFYVEVPAGVRPEYVILGVGANFTL